MTGDGRPRRSLLIAAAAIALVAAALVASRLGPVRGATAGSSVESGAEAPYAPSQEDELAAELLSSAETVVEERPGEVISVATEVAEAYGERGDCLLAQAGYLDLAGNVWSCLAYGGDWAEVCVVAGGEDGEKCEVRIWRLESEEVEAALS